MSASQRRKGAAYERELAKRWRDDGLYPEAKRGIGQARSGGEVSDVEGTPWWIEAKRRKRHDVRAAMRQAIEASDGRAPVVVARYDGDAADEALVVMRLADWESLVRRIDATLLERIPTKCQG